MTGGSLRRTCCSRLILHAGRNDKRLNGSNRHVVPNSCPVSHIKYIRTGDYSKVIANFVSNPIASNINFCSHTFST